MFGLVDEGDSIQGSGWRQCGTLYLHSSIEDEFQSPGNRSSRSSSLGDNNQYGFPATRRAGALLDGPRTIILGLFRCHEKKVAMITTGMADWQPTCYRLKQSSDPDVKLGDHRVNFATGNWDAGLIINDMGTVRGFPWGSRPGFYNIWGRFGATFIGNGPGPHTFEDLMSAYPTDERSSWVHSIWHGWARDPSRAYWQ